ncbi:serine/threonine-protein kinase [Actinomadura hibisca]|uniref:serine/threonine-protein kinase n=1 Tax=Actinomadura hibisca TaxID=68565 RepID=UPI00082EE6AB|nr:serine/threonine-protein kinase [Actinomadura hibisca]
MHEHSSRDGLPAGVHPLVPGSPASIGPYPLLGKLGEGGMGSVYLGRGPDGRHVAIKVIQPGLAADERYRARFHDEVRHARQVASFCTAAVLDHGEDGGRPYLVTEYVAGEPLSEHIRRHGALPPGTLHGVAVGVAAALTAIHSAGLVHRDLKPANVILSISGPRVIDFGIARGVDQAGGHTKAGFVVGSPGWIAPEQVRTGQVSPAGDVFAWGCLVAFAGTGRHPFGVADSRATSDPLVLAYRAHQHDYDLGGLTDPLRSLVRRALAPEPEDRPTAQQLLLALVGGSDPAVAVAGGAVAPAAPAGHDIQAIASHTVESTWRTEDLPLWSPPTSPLAPVRPAPPVDPGLLRRARVRTWVGRTVGLTVLAGLGVGGFLLYRADKAPAAAQFDQPAKDGDFTFQASRPECDRTVKGVTAEDGKLCQVRFSVANVASSARVLDPAVQRLHGAADSEEPAIMLFKGSTPGPKSRVGAQTLASGTRFSGVLLYDVPPGFTPRELELHADGTSKGIRLPLAPS